MMLLSLVLFTSLAVAIPRSSVHYRNDPYAEYHHRIAKRADNGTALSLQVDLGYAQYRGYYDNETLLNQWLGMRYAQPPVGQLRWQQPRAPRENRSAVIDADSYGSSCPQAPNAGDSYTTSDNSGNSEDCLFINVIAPTNTSVDEQLPVMVWLHPGGYAAGSGGLDFSNLMHTNGNGFLTVTLNYRLGAFGFLSSDEVHFRGTPNAGIHDQQLALQWVQRYIHLFGGDKTQVTIFGESAGGGSVMLHDIAYGGTLGTKLFKNSASSSPYLAFQYGYNAWQPSQAYYAFANAVGCDISHAYLHNGSKPIFDCLIEADTQTLIEANVNISQSGTWGSFAFLPVTDGNLIQDRPSKALKEGKINGVNHLAGHQALEGASWVAPHSISTINNLVDYIDRIFPMFSNNDLAKLLHYYDLNNASTDWDAPLWATAGDSGPTTLNQSTAATGQQQRAIAIYGETTFICPSYWLAEAYSDNRLGGQGFKYQFSIPNAYHGADGAAYLRDPSDPAYYGFDATTAFQTMIGNFIMRDDPRIPSLIANGISTGNETYNPVSDWPAYNLYNPMLLDFNTTCPDTEIIGDLPYCVGDDAELTLRLADAYSWEGGRGERCDFWKLQGELVPE